MNKQERVWLSRLSAAVMAVPLPHDGGGRSTATIQGMVEYQADMRLVVPLVREAIAAICCHRDEGYAEWGEPPDEVLTRLETVVATRRGEAQ